MIKKKIVNEDEKNKVKKILSISLPEELYQFLLEKSGKGNVGSFVREAIEEKIMKADSALVNAYKSLEENEEYESIKFQETWEEKTEPKEQKNNDKPEPKRQKAK
jgi:hypothetical protein